MGERREKAKEAVLEELQDLSAPRGSRPWQRETSLRSHRGIHSRERTDVPVQFERPYWLPDREGERGHLPRRRERE